MISVILGIKEILFFFTSLTLDLPTNGQGSTNHITCTLSKLSSCSSQAVTKSVLEGARLVMELIWNLSYFIAKLSTFSIDISNHFSTKATNRTSIDEGGGGVEGRGGLDKSSGKYEKKKVNGLHC